MFTNIREFNLSHAQCGKVVKNTITIFTEKLTFFRQNNGFTTEVTKELI